MKTRSLLLCSFVISLLLFGAWTFPDEGMWMLNQLDRLPWAEMQKHGLKLTPKQIYDPDGPSLKDAIVLLGGGTSSFISADGLILTNHHVAFSAIQSVSSTQDDYLKNGYLAKTKGEELSIPTYTAQVVVSQQEITPEVLGDLKSDIAPAEKADSVRVRVRRIEQAAQKKSGYDCRAAEFFNGVKYYLFSYQAFRDVRLVYAPPTAIGNYGGEVDNWYWPRHTGDFSLMRVYASADGKPARYSKDNVPYKPKVFLPISSQGYEEGSFAMIMGFPGRTFRYRTSDEIELAKDETLPLTIQFYKKRMDIIEAAGKNDRAVEIQYASKWRGLANTFKNYEGTLEGMKRSAILDERKEDEKSFRAFLSSKPALDSSYGSVLADIAKATADLKVFNRKQIGYNNLVAGSDILGIAARFVTLANHFAKDSAGASRAPETEVQNLKEFLTRAFKDISVGVDKELLTGLLLMNADLPADQRLGAVARLAGSRTGEEREKSVRERVKDMFEHSKLTTLEGCLKLLDRPENDIRDDELVKFAAELDKDNAPLQALASSFNARVAALRSKLLEARMAWKGPDLYPDANRTLRFTYGTVKPYVPRDAVTYDYVTTLKGVMEKETGEDPFIVPARLKELWEKKDFGPYADSRTHDIPVAFIADLDITGGNSGSPVINGKGELIGIAFDGNWEAVVGDYLFQDDLNRTISVDSRYVLFVLDKYSNATDLLHELVVH